MKFTITREQLQEGLVAVAASVPTKTTLPGPVQHPARGDQGRAAALRHRSRHRGEHHRAGLGGPGGRHHAPRPEAGRRSSASCPAPAIRLTTSGEQRVTIECGRSKFRLLGLPREEFPAFPHGEVRRRLADHGQGSAEADRPRGVRGQHRGEPPDPERRALGAAARTGCGWWPPTAIGWPGWTCRLQPAAAPARPT